MSQLIDQLKAESGDPRSERELTLIFGDQAAQSGRQDIFEKNPDFASEYQQVKGEINRANRPPLSEEFMGGLESGGHELAAAGYGLGALATGAVGADETSAGLLERARASEEAAQENKPSVPSISDISAEHPLSDTAYYLARGVGSMLPSLGLGAAGAAAGAAVGSAVEPGGGTIAGGLAGLVEGFTGDEAVQNIIAAAARQGTKMSLEDASALATKQLAQKIGSEGALAAAFTGQSAGSNYIRNPQTPGADLAFGAAAGVLGAVAPGYVLSRFLPEGASQEVEQQALGYWQRFVGEAAKVIPIGAGTTAASQLVDIAADKYSRGEDPTDFTAGDMKAALNAGVMGGVGGAILAPFAAIPGGPRGGDSSVSAATPQQPSESAVTPPPQARAGPAPAAPAAPAAQPIISTAGLPPEVADAVTSAQQAANAIQGVPEPVAAADLAVQSAGGPAPTDNVAIGNLIGQQVQYQGYNGTLVRDQEGNFMVLPAIRAAGSPMWTEVAGTGKDPGTMASAVGLMPLEEPAQAPKPAPATPPLPQGQSAVSAPGSDTSLRSMFPPTEAPRPGVNPTVFSQPGTVLEAQNGPPKQLDPNWKVTIQSAQGDIPGYTQIDMVGADGQNAGSTSPEKLIAQGYDMPNLQNLEQGQYTVADLQKQVPKPETAPAVPVPDPDQAMPEPTEPAAPADETHAGPDTAALPDNREEDLVEPVQQSIATPPSIPSEALAAKPDNTGISMDDIRQMSAAYRNQDTGKIDVSPEPGEGHVRFAERLGISDDLLSRNPDDQKGLKGPWGIKGYDYGLVDKDGDFHTIPELDAALKSNPASGVNPDVAITGPEGDRGAVLPGRDGPVITPLESTDAHVSQLADRKQMAAQKDFITSTVADAAKKAPDELVITDAGRADFEKAQAIKDGFVEASASDAPVGKKQQMVADAVNLAVKYGMDEAEARKFNASTLAGNVQDLIRQKTGEKVTVEVPGDGTFRVSNDKASLKAFGEMVEKWFGKGFSLGRGADHKVPPPTDLRVGTNKPSPASVIPPVKINPSVADLTKAASMATTTDPTRFILTHTLQDGKYTVATDGRRLFLTLGGKGKTQAEITAAETAKLPSAERAAEKKQGGTYARFPNWQQVIPGFVKLTGDKINIANDAPPVFNVDTSNAIKAVHQAMGVLTEKSNSIKIYDLGGGNIGISGSSPDVGDYASPGLTPTIMADPKNAKAAVNPGYFYDALVAARLSGDKNIGLYVKDDVSPIVMAGKKFLSVTMPVRLATERVSSDFISAGPNGIALADSVIKALVKDRGVPVVQMAKDLMGAVESAVQTSGVTITRDTGLRMVGYALDSVHGVMSPDSVISLLHEAAHVFTQDLPESQRVALQQAIDELPWTRQRWLANPLSLDVRLLANADPDTLSPKQIEALKRLTPQEIARAKAIDPTVLAGERMAEHLAQLGWDKQQATSVVAKVFRFVKNLWNQAAMSIQKILKGPDNVSPDLVRQFVENRFLQFVNRDAATGRNAINSLLDWIGVPATTLERQPSFPAGLDTETRMQFADGATGAMIPVSYGAYTPDSLQSYVQRSVDNAARYMRAQQGRAADVNVEFTQRVNFSRPLPFDPTNTQNVVLASINLEDEIYQQMRQDKEMSLRLPMDNGMPMGHSDFLTEMLRMPDQQTPENRRAAAIDLAGRTTDPLSGKPIAFDPKITVDRLPSFTETIRGKEKEAVKINLSEQQDEAIKQTILALRDTRRRMQSTFERESQRLEDLLDQRTEQKDEFPKSAQKELDDLQRSAPLRGDLISMISGHLDNLDAKFDPSLAVKIYPTAEYLRIPSPDATQAQILSNPKGTIPRDLNFSNDTVKAALGQDLADMRTWLDTPGNRSQGVIYGQMDETYRKLMQIPVNLERANTAALLRRTVTNGLSEELRLSGMPALVAMAKRINNVSKIIGENRVEATTLGSRWNETFGKFAESMGRTPDQSFREDTWDMLMRVWNHIDVSKREAIPGSGPTAPVELTARAMSELAGFDIKTDAQRTALRDLMLSTIDSERWQMSVEKQNDVRVNDPELGYERRLIPRGLAAGRRSIARHMTGLYMRMNPDWADTKPVAPEDPRSFWKAGKDLYGENRPLFDQQMKRMFPSYVVKDFVEPLVYNNTEVFKAPTTPEDSSSRMASLIHVRQAWEQAQGDPTRFAEVLHGLEAGAQGDESQTVGNVLSALREKFYEIKGDQDGRLGQEGNHREVLPRQIMDARLAHDWPAEWVSYGTYSPADNLTVLHQLAVAAGLGKDALSGNSEVQMTLQEAKRDIAELWARHEELHQAGLSPAAIDKQMGEANAAIARRYWALNENITNVTKALSALTTNTGYLTGDFKAFNSMVGFLSTMMIQNPRSGAVNIIGDVQGPLAALKLSRPGLKAMFGSASSVARDMATSLLRAFGADVKFNTNLAEELYINGASDPAQAVTWKQRQYNFGPGQTLAKPSGYESTRAMASRNISNFANRGRDILPNVGSPFDVGAKPGDAETQVIPKMRAGFFNTTTMSTMLANNRSGYSVFSDLAMRGVKYLNSLPDGIREKTVRALELGTRDLDNRQLGYNRGLILNDEAAFNYLKDAIETKLTGESSVGRFVAKAFRRQEAAAGSKWPILSNSQFSDIINLTNSEWTLVNSFANLPPWMSGAMRPLFTFLTWPYQAMHRFGRTFVDPRGRLTWRGFNSTVADGMKTFFVLAAPATVAGSFAIDLYDKYALGKKQNLREASLGTALPGVGAAIDPKAFMERIGRYGSAGFATDVLNRIVNYDTQRNLSLDDRIVAVSSMESLLNALAVEPFQSQGNITYASTIRPFLESIGAGGVLQYLQIANNLLGLNNQEAAINARINTNNYIRSSGRALGMPVRVQSGPAEAPSPVSPYMHQLELAAIVDNQSLFRAALANARAVLSEEARQKGNPDPDGYAMKYIASNFSERQPLRRSFVTPPTESQYREMLGLMGDLGSSQVRAAINNYNRYLQTYFHRQPFYGRADRNAPSVDQLLHKASRLYRQPENDLAVSAANY